MNYVRSFEFRFIEGFLYTPTETTIEVRLEGIDQFRAEKIRNEIRDVLARNLGHK